MGVLPFLAVVALLMTLAEIEFCHLLALAGFRPAVVFGVGILWLFLIDAHLSLTEMLLPGVALLLMGSLAWQMSRRTASPVVDWSLTVAGGLYLGACSACLIRLRSVGANGDGLWWTMTALPAIMLADSGAYAVGRLWGRRKLAPVLSPHKTWEGYLAGVALGGFLTAVLAWLWSARAGAGTTISGLHGLILGLTVAAIAPLGDLAISMVKRQVGAKHSGKAIPGHGGALDRVDSVLWAAVIGYCYVLWFVPGV